MSGRIARCCNHGTIYCGRCTAACMLCSCRRSAPCISHRQPVRAASKLPLPQIPRLACSVLMFDSSQQTQCINDVNFYFLNLWWIEKTKKGTRLRRPQLRASAPAEARVWPLLLIISLRMHRPKIYSSSFIYSQMAKCATRSLSSAKVAPQMHPRRDEEPAAAAVDRREEC